MVLTAFGVWVSLALLRYGRSMTLSLLYTRHWRLVLVAVLGQGVSQIFTGYYYPLASNAGEVRSRVLYVLYVLCVSVCSSDRHAKAMQRCCTHLDTPVVGRNPRTLLFPLHHYSPAAAAGRVHVAGLLGGARLRARGGLRRFPPQQQRGLLGYVPEPTPRR